MSSVLCSTVFTFLSSEPGTEGIIVTGRWGAEQGGVSLLGDKRSGNQSVSTHHTRVPSLAWASWKLTSLDCHHRRRPAAAAVLVPFPAECCPARPPSLPRSRWSMRMLASEEALILVLVLLLLFCWQQRSTLMKLPLACQGIGWNVMDSLSLCLLSSRSCTVSRRTCLGGKGRESLHHRCRKEGKRFGRSRAESGFRLSIRYSVLSLLPTHRQQPKCISSQQQAHLCTYRRSSRSSSTRCAITLCISRLHHVLLSAPSINRQVH